MARVLVQSTNVPGSVCGLRKHGQPKGSGEAKRKVTVKMMASLQLPGLRMRSFSGLRGANALDTMARPGQDFHSKVAAAITMRRKRPSRCVPKAMFERFTEKAIKVIMLAQEEARRLGHNFVGTEQILLGLIGEGTGIAAKVLKSMGISLKEARVEVEKIIGRGSGFVAVEIPFTPRAKRVLELSLEEARQLGISISLPPCSLMPWITCRLSLKIVVICLLPWVFFLANMSHAVHGVIVAGVKLKFLRRAF